MPWMIFRPMSPQLIAEKLCLIELTILGIAATIFGIAFKSPVTRAPISCTPLAMIVGRFRMIAEPTVWMSWPAVAMIWSMLPVMPLASVEIIIAAPSMSAGSATMRPWTSPLRIVPPADMICGRAAVKPSTIVVMMAGRFWPIVSTTGRMFCETAPIESNRLLTRFVMSAFPFATPATRVCQALCSIPRDPAIVCVASRSKLPAYWLVCSKK